MDSCQSVERELERLAKKYNNLGEHTDSSLTELIYQIVTIQEDLLKGMTEVLSFRQPPMLLPMNMNI